MGTLEHSEKFLRSQSAALKNGLPFLNWILMLKILLKNHEWNSFIPNERKMYL